MLSPCHGNQFRNGAGEDSPDPNADAPRLNQPVSPCTKTALANPEYHQRIQSISGSILIHVKRPKPT